MINDMDGRAINPGDIVCWIGGGLGSERLVCAPASRYGEWQGHEALWVTLPTGGEAPFLAKDGPHLLGIDPDVFANPDDIINLDTIRDRLFAAL